MNEVTQEKIGRTYADAFVEIFSTSRLVLLIIGLLAVTFLVVHNAAEPGTSIEFLGIIKYQKAKPAQTPIQTPIDETASYYLPVNEKLSLASNTAVPILDGTLAVKANKYYLLLVGDNISYIHVGLRNVDGTPTDFLKREGDSAITFGINSYLEIFYRGKFFAVEVREDERYKTATVTARLIPRATLKLNAISQLSHAGGGD